MEEDIFGNTEEELERLDAEDFKWKLDVEDAIGKK